MDDLISRQEVLTFIEKSVSEYGDRYSVDMLNMWGLFAQVVKDMPPARQWIPWVENDTRLKDHYYYLVTHVGHEIPMLAKFHDDGCYFEIISMYPHKSIYVWDNDIITAWMPLPEIYKGETES